MASFMTNKGAASLANGAVDWDTDTIKIMLLKSTYTADKDDDFVSLLTSSEADATNYAGTFGGAGRKSLASKTVTADNTNDRAVLDAADVTWTALGGATNNTLRLAAVIKEITNDAASIIIGYLDFGSNKSTNGGDFTIQFAAAGLFYNAT